MTLDMITGDGCGNNGAKQWTTDVRNEGLGSQWILRAHCISSFCLLIIYCSGASRKLGPRLKILLNNCAAQTVVEIWRFLLIVSSCPGRRVSLQSHNNLAQFSYS
jgi:hypothetical protein